MESNIFTRYPVGMRVHHSDWGNGTIVHHDRRDTSVLFQADVPNEGMHDGQGHANRNTGWWLFSEGESETVRKLTPIQNESGTFAVFNLDGDGDLSNIDESTYTATYSSYEAASEAALREAEYAADRVVIMKIVASVQKITQNTVIRTG